MGELTGAFEIPCLVIAFEAGFDAPLDVCRERGLTEFDVGLQRRVVKLDEQVASLYVVAFAVEDLDDAPTRFRRYARAQARSQRACLGICDRRLDGAVVYFDDLDLDAFLREHGEPKHDGKGDNDRGSDPALRVAFALVLRI